MDHGKTNLTRRALLVRGGWLTVGAAMAGFPAMAGSMAAELSVVDVAYAGSMGSMMEGPLKASVAQTLKVDMHGLAQGSSALAQLIVAGSIRPDVTGAPIHAAPSGLFLNPAAYTAPAPGQWGNAGRDSIVGPAVFSWNGSIGRAFLLEGRYNLDLRLESTNFLNHVTFTNWNAIVNSAQFGLPAAANSMRQMLLTASLRF